jgi:hypothetical protein
MAAKDVAPAVNGHSRRMVPTVTLSSGHRMPAVGLGVRRMEIGEERRPRPHPRRHRQRLPPLPLRQYACAS